MRWINLLLLIAIISLMGCQPCPQGDNACYKFKYGLVPDETKASGYRPLTLAEYILGEEKISEKNQKKP